MSASSIPRSAGIGLLVYAATTFTAFMFSGAPGGDYAADRVASYVDPGHAPVAFVLWSAAGLGALALVPFGAGLRRLPGIGSPLMALTTVGAALSATGAWLAGGVEVGMIEGGGAVRSGAPAAVVYLVTEIGNAMAVCGPAMCVGIVGIALAVRRAVPAWLGVLSVIGGVCGILAPFFTPYFVYLLWVLVLGVVLITGPRAKATPRTERLASIV